MTRSWCSMKSNSTSKIILPYGMGEVVSPLELTYSGTCHQWFTCGERARRTLPTIWVHICNVSQVSAQAERGSKGQASGESKTALVTDMSKYLSFWSQSFRKFSSSWKLVQHHLVYVAPTPVLSRLDRLHDGMMCPMKMFRRVLILG